MRGSVVERGQNRQWKLEGVDAWYFDYMMGSLRLMLQISLLLLGCALSKYLWEINILIAAVVLGVTSLGVIFCIFIAIAGVISESCPYQTPGADIFRSVFRHTIRRVRNNLTSAIRSAFSIIPTIPSTFPRIARNSATHRTLTNIWSTFKRPWYSMDNVVNILALCPATVVGLATDAFRLVLVVLRLLSRSSKAAYRHSFGRVAYHWVTGTFHSSRGLGRSTITLDLHCISWVLLTSLEKNTHWLALEHLVSVSEFSHFHPTIILDCFNILVGCVSVNDGQAVVSQGFEQLAIASAASFFKTFYNLTIMDPTSSVLAELHRRYNAFFPTDVDFTGLPFSSAMSMTHALASRLGNPRYVWWDNHRRFSQEHIPFSKRMVQAAKAEYRKMQRRKVPRWILRAALHFLSLGSVDLSPAIPDYLMIIAMDLGCDIQDRPVLDERYFYTSDSISMLLTWNQHTSGATLDIHH